MTDLKDIVNTVTQVFTILESNESESMPSSVAALPRDVDVFSTTGWVAELQEMVAPLVFPRAHPNPFFPDQDELRLGIRWLYGGQVDGQGRYIKDAEAYVNVDYIAPTMNYDIKAKFAATATPIGPEPVAMLTATISVRVSQTLVGVLFSQTLGVRIFGDGAGDIRYVG